MKNSIKIIVAFFALILILSFTPNKNSHIGVWKGIDKGETGYFTFDSAGFATIEIQGKVIGGRSFGEKGVTAQMTYTIDYNARPIAIDLIITEIESNKETLRAKGIIEFTSADKMKISLSLNSDTRPTQFVEKETIILSREK